MAGRRVGHHVMMIHHMTYPLLARRHNNAFGPVSFSLGVGVLCVRGSGVRANAMRWSELLASRT